MFNYGFLSKDNEWLNPGVCKETTKSTDLESFHARVSDGDLVTQGPSYQNEAGAVLLLADELGVPLVVITGTTNTPHEEFNRACSMLHHYVRWTHTGIPNMTAFCNSEGRWSISVWLS